MIGLKFLLVMLLIFLISATNNVIRNAEKEESKFKRTTIEKHSLKNDSTILRNNLDFGNLRYKRETYLDKQNNNSPSSNDSEFQFSPKYREIFTESSTVENITTLDYSSSDISSTIINSTLETTEKNITEDDVRARESNSSSTESNSSSTESNSSSTESNSSSTESSSSSTESSSSSTETTSFSTESSSSSTESSSPSTESSSPSTETSSSLTESSSSSTESSSSSTESNSSSTESSSPSTETSSSSTESSSSSTESSSSSAKTSTEPSTSKPNNDDILCPKSLNHFQNQEQNGTTYCYYITELGKYDDLICPYSGNIFIEGIYSRIIESINISTSWITAKRNNSFSPYILEYWNTFYVLSETLITGDYSDKNCLIYENNGFYSEDCNASHQMVCLYDIYNKEILYESHCHLKDDSLWPSDLNSELCYQYSNNNESENFAEPLEYYQFKRLDEMIETEALFTNVCRVGIEQIDNKIVFSSSKNEMEYANNIQIRGSDQYGYLYKLFSSSILFSSIYFEECSILEIKTNITEEPVNIYLTFNNKYVIGTILNMDNIFGSRLYCKFGDKLLTKFANETIDLKGKLQFIVEPYFSYPHYFWCQAIHVKTNAIIESNNVVVYNEAYYGKDYIINVVLQYYVDSGTTLNHEIDKILTNINQNLISIDANYINDSVRVIKIDETENNKYDVNFHISTKKSDTNRTDEIELFNKTLSDILENYVYTIVNSVYCLEEQEINNKIILVWPETPIGSTVAPNSNSVCVTNSYRPVTRRCIGNFENGAKWTQTNGECSATSVTQNTNDLHNISQMSNTSSVIGKKLNEVTTRMISNTSEAIHPIDMDYVAKILRKISVNTTTDEYAVINDIYDTVSNIIKIDRNILNESQAQLNATDNILFSLDQILLKICNSSTNCNSNTSESNKIDIRISNLENVVGWKVLSNRTILELTKDTTVDEILNTNEDFEIASFVPNDILSQFEENQTNPTLIMTFFYSDQLFNVIDSDIRTDKIVLSILLTNFSSVFNVPLPIIYNSHNSNAEKRNCVFWKYGFDDKLEAINGTWSENPSHISNTTNQFQICNYTHLTHFGMLVNGDDNLDENTKNILNIITIAGTILSSSGVVLILLTAIVFKKWRNVKFNITQLNFLLSTIFTTVCLFLADYVPSGSFCITIGIFLHYAIISQFCWMLIMSYLAYKKYVVVFNVHIRKLKEKTYFMGWIVPIIPIMVIALIDIQEYDRNSKTSLCYLHDLYFKIGILLPICLILTTNLVFYVLIVLSLTILRPLQKVHQGEISKILRLIALLTFQMGLVWIFGIILTFNDNLVVSYIFAIGCSIQGFIISLGHFLMGHTKKYWMDSIIKKLNGDSETNSSNYKNTNE